VTALAILLFCIFLGSLTAVLVQLFINMRSAGSTQRVMWNASTRIHDVTDLALRRMLEEALRSMSGERGMQGPLR